MNLKTIVLAVIASIALGSFGLGRVAFADDAEEHMAKGTRYYNIQDWPNALKEYKQAYTLDPKPETLWAIAQTQRLSGDCRGAILTYKAYLRGASVAGASAAEDSIKKCQADVDAQQHAVEAAVPPPSGEPPPVVTNPPATNPLQTTPAQDETTPGTPGLAKSSSRAWYRDPLGDALLGGGIVGLAVGTLVVLEGNSKMSVTGNAGNVGGYNAQVSSAQSWQNAGIAVGIAGVALAGVSVWRYIVVTHRGGEKAAVQITPVTGGATAGIGGQF